MEEGKFTRTPLSDDNPYARLINKRFSGLINSNLWNNFTETRRLLENKSLEKRKSALNPKRIRTNFELISIFNDRFPERGLVGNGRGVW